MKLTDIFTPTATPDVLNVTQASHGFTIGDVVRRDGTLSIYSKALADLDTNAEAVGIVSYVNGSTFIITLCGPITGLSGLTDGQVYRLSYSVAGQLTADPALAGTIDKPMLLATSSTSGIVLQMRGVMAQLTGEAQGSVYYKPTLTVGQTVITLPWTYTTAANQLLVVRNGIVQYLGSQFTETSTTTITLVSAITTGEDLSITRMPNGYVQQFSAAPTIDEGYVATAAQTAFTLSTPYLVGNKSLKVFKNGQLQDFGDYEETDGLTITFLVGMTGGEKVRFVQYGAMKSSTTIFSNYQEFVSTLGQTAFNLAFTYTPGSNELLITSGGISMSAGASADYQETNASTITFNSGRALNEKVTVRRIGASSATSMRLRELQVATTGQTVFNLAGTYVPGGSLGSLLVFRNGKLLMGSEYVETNSQCVTLNAGVDAGDEMLFMVVGGDVVSYTDAGVINWEIQTSTAGQTLFTLGLNYNIGSGGLAIYKNSVRLFNGVDYLETSQNSVTMLVAGLLGDKFLFENRAKVMGGNEGVQSWYQFPTPMTIGQSVFTVPFRYAPGTHQLHVIRNGVVSIPVTQYTEDSAVQITVIPAITSTTETIVVETITSAKGGSKNHTFAYHDDAMRMLPAGQSFRNLKINCTSNTQVVIKSGTTVMADTWDDAMLFAADKTVDITVAGDGGLDTGTEAANTWYYIWAILNTVTRVTSAVISTSTSAPALPSGYTKKRLIGVARNDGSSNFLQFMQSNCLLNYNGGRFNLLNGGTAGSFTPLSVISYVPTAVSSIAVFVMQSVSSYAVIGFDGVGVFVAAQGTPGNPDELLATMNHNAGNIYYYTGGAAYIGVAGFILDL